MSVYGIRLAEYLEEIAPSRYAVPKDPIGLQVGTLNRHFKHILVTLDITEGVIDEAIAQQADMILAHHALLFRPLSHVRSDTVIGRMVEKLVKHQICVYILHTNLDIVDGGINDLMADALGIQEREPLDITYQESLFKLAVYVPIEAKKQVREAMFAAGAGEIGAYACCSFSSQGEGTFFPSLHTNPYIGTPEKTTYVKEEKIETIVPESLREKVLVAMHQAHPYEEVAYDLLPLHQKGSKKGLGRVGTLKEEVTLHDLSSQVKSCFYVSCVRTVGDLNKKIRKVAVLGGSGSKFISHALAQEADVLITGDIDFHTAQDALAEGLCLIDPGHHSEKIMKFYLSEELKKRLPKTKITISEVNTDPFVFV